MKEDIINIIKILGIGIKELVLDIDIGVFYVNSIEFIEPDEIILHNFEDDETDVELNFDDLEERHQKHLWLILSILLYN
jgi:hypothetical protein